MTSILGDTIAVPLAPQKDCKAMRFNPSGKYIAVCTNEGTCILYGASVPGGDGRSTMLSVIRGHMGPVWDVSEAGHNLLTCPTAAVCFLSNSLWQPMRDRRK